MNKKELIAAIAEKAGISKKAAAEALDATLACITDTLASGEKIQLPGFGTFEVRHRKPHTGRNPATNQIVEYPESNAPAFKPGKTLKSKVH